MREAVARLSAVKASAMKDIAMQMNAARIQEKCNLIQGYLLDSYLNHRNLNAGLLFKCTDAGWAENPRPAGAENRARPGFPIRKGRRGSTRRES